jgi:hypothetical protein
MKQFPSMKARAAYALLKGDGIIPSEEISSNANRMAPVADLKAT